MFPFAQRIILDLSKNVIVDFADSLNKAARYLSRFSDQIVNRKKYEYNSDLSSTSKASRTNPQMILFFI
ncbi:hypothetical protein DP113_16840 [Brasilonema octagenarum UFV-E1]|jgi:hypothetical protein|uniref:Uncharacterized protein n=2 Tax=Brasilonema TaxID=383614 RepID=A0A856MGQ2_9CYAN|nr:hypothetical protein [Brasilonema octagenarum UFV-OR1]QDL09359.1 hypothetical protein DP114_16905 [Brasilonema sennae CENA114]QDL15715.1 hypothetical protein DP113_16840 [Brasilonema octagenarum UFV-E1]